MPGSKGKTNKHSRSTYLQKCKLVANFDLLSLVEFVNLKLLGQDFRVFRGAYFVEGIFFYLINIFNAYDLNPVVSTSSCDMLIVVF